ncbi:alanine racemase [Minwuia thermotolerans]|uniref:Alanine racemase n=2 Tax=Minwuia thermotolerans TaxID=2056226 RepID=A0A2M9G1Q8_9PROT|nr:alanine racemase [Minwuia thermotolerans]
MDMVMIPKRLAAATLTIDLGALADNWRLLDRLAGRAETAAVVKADAYGIGIAHAVPALAAAGCRTFFTALPDEGEQVRRHAPDSVVYVLDGLLPGAEDDYAALGLIPVLNDLGQIERWRRHAAALGRRLACAIHLDTGMTRLGLLGQAVERLIAEPALLDGLDVRAWLTHPACADLPGHEMNAHQLALFRERTGRLPRAARSAANSPAIFLDPEWHMDLVRPGVALYGSNPSPLCRGAMKEVVHLKARVLQVHEVTGERTIGYGATHRLGGPGRIATCGVGYGDGYLRSFGNRGFGVIAGHRVPLVGRVSMDLISFDITGVPEGRVEPAAEISLIGDGVDIDELAAKGDTIAYELLTGLGARYARDYVGASV